MPALAISKRLEVFSHREEYFWARLSLSIDCFGFVASISVAPVLVGIEYNFTHPSRRCQFPDTDLRVYTPVEIRRLPDETFGEVLARLWAWVLDGLAELGWAFAYLVVVCWAWARLGCRRCLWVVVLLSWVLLVALIFAVCIYQVVNL